VVTSVERETQEHEMTDTEPLKKIKWLKASSGLFKNSIPVPKTKERVKFNKDKSVCELIMLRCRSLDQLNPVLENATNGG
jgi:hypothetical protein